MGSIYVSIVHRYSNVPEEFSQPSDWKTYHEMICFRRSSQVRDWTRCLCKIIRVFFVRESKFVSLFHVTSFWRQLSFRIMLATAPLLQILFRSKICHALNSVICYIKINFSFQMFLNKRKYNKKWGKKNIFCWKSWNYIYFFPFLKFISPYFLLSSVQVRIILLINENKCCFNH